MDHFREASAYRAGSHPWNFSSRHLYFYNHMMEEIREALDQNRFMEYKKNKLDGMKALETK